MTMGGWGEVGGGAKGEAGRLGCPGEKQWWLEQSVEVEGAWLGMDFGSGDDRTL